MRIVLLLLGLSSILLALSKEERIIRASLHPYTIKGITYHPYNVTVGETKEVLASWYGEYFHGRKTALGEIYDMYGYTAAHKTFPLGTVLLVSNLKNGKSLKVRINDRGPFWNEREIDLSMAAAEFLETKEAGVAKVLYKVLSVPSILKSFKSSKERLPLNPTYNIGYTAISYNFSNEMNKLVSIKIGTFFKKKDAKEYLKKLFKYQPKAHIITQDYNYKIEFSLKNDEKLVTKRLKKLKKLGLITGYGVCWGY